MVWPVRIEVVAVGGLLASAGVLKLMPAAGAAFVASTPLRTSVSGGALRGLNAALSVFEIGLGCVLLATATTGAVLLAAALLAGGAFYQAWTMRQDSSAPCGCLGTATSAPPSRGSVAANIVIAAGLIIATLFPQGPEWALVVSAAAVAVGFSLMAWNIVRGRPSGSEAEGCATIAVAAETTLQALYESKLWTETVRHLSSRVPSDNWREACWRYFVFPVLRQDQELVAVYAVHVTEPATKRSMVLIDEARGCHVEVFR